MEERVESSGHRFSHNYVGCLVADVDYAGYGVDLSFPRTYFNVSADKDSVVLGDTVTLTVDIGSGDYSDIRLITSDVRSCNKIIEPHLKFGEVVSFDCSIEDIQETTTVRLV